MGLKLGKLLKKVVKTGVPLAAGFLTGGPMGAGMAGLGLLQAKGQKALTSGGVGAAIPSIQEFTGVGPFMQRQFMPARAVGNGMVQPVAAGAVAVVGGMSRAVIAAIVRLAGALGIGVTAANVGRVGVRLWRSVNALARRHPGFSILAFLTGLGLAAEEAAEFLFWGQTKARRRRGRGISARDIRVCRRTIRKMAGFRRDLGSLGPPARRGAPHHHHPRAGVV